MNFNEVGESISAHYLLTLVFRIKGFGNNLFCVDKCSDITNDQLGISGETGTVARISVFIE